MKALLFPGQGSQSVGMGSEFYKNFDIVKKIFEEADEKLGFKISKIILEGPDTELKLTKNTQPAILIISYSIFKVLENEFGLEKKKIKYFAGHSLGEYSALVCSNSLNFRDALFLLHERGKAMQEAVPLGDGSMLAVLGVNIEEINNFISKISEKKVCEIANDNADGQIIISGETKAIDELKTILKNNNKKNILLPVSAPFHCSLMQSAAKKMKNKINPIIFKKPDLETISNVTALPEKDPDKIKKLLVEQIYSKVRWRESIINISKKGITDFIEIGPGKVLSGLVKRIIKDSNTMSINSVEEIKKIIDEFKK